MKSRSATEGSSPGRLPILVVEDDLKLLGMLEEYLLGQGFAVLCATSAAKAMELLSQQTFALVLLDWELSQGRPEEPGTGGAVLEACRERDPLLPVIVISGHEATDVRTDAVLAETDSFLAKPFSLALLGNHLRHWLDRVNSTRLAWKLSSRDDILPLEEVKRRYVTEAVKLLGGNVTEAARRLKLHRHTVAALAEEEGGAPRSRERA